MHQVKSMTLHLQQAIAYKAAPKTFTEAEEAYQYLLAHLDAQEVGSEGCLALSSTLSVIFLGIQDPPDATIRNLIEQGLPLPSSTDPYHIEPGKFQVLQLPVQDRLCDMIQQIPMLFDGPNRIYLRILKENPITLVAQVWVSC